MLDEDGRTWIPRNQSALAEGIADALFNRDDAETWMEMAEVVIRYLRSVGIVLPPDNDLPPVWDNPVHAENTKSAMTTDAVNGMMAHVPAAVDALDGLAGSATATNVYTTGMLRWGVTYPDGTIIELPTPTSIEWANPPVLSMRDYATMLSTFGPSPTGPILGSVSGT